MLSEKSVGKDVKTVMAVVTNLQGEKVGFLKVDIRSSANKRESIFQSSQVDNQSPQHIELNKNPSLLKT
jgi:uncharacterized protein YrrD